MGVGFGYYAYLDLDSIEGLADVFSNKIFYLLNQNTYSVMENDTLVAIPLFLFMGYVVERANIVNRLFDSLQLAARNLPGSMAVAALLTCAVFSTASGIVGAVVTLMGLLAYPGHGQSQLRQELCLWCYLRWRHAGYSHSPVHHVDCLRGNCRFITPSPLCSGCFPRADSGW